MERLDFEQWNNCALEEKHAWNVVVTPGSTINKAGCRLTYISRTSTMSTRGKQGTLGYLTTGEGSVMIK